MSSSSDETYNAYVTLAGLMEVAYRGYYTKMVQDATSNEQARTHVENPLLQALLTDYVVPLSNTESVKARVAIATVGIDYLFEHALSSGYTESGAAAAHELIENDKKVAADVVSAYTIVAGLIAKTKWATAFSELVAGWNSVAAGTEFAIAV